MSAPDSAKQGVVHMVGNAARVFSFRIAGAVLTFSIQLLIARWAGAEVLGLYVFGLSACVIVSIVAGLGYAHSGVRFLGAYLGQADRARLVGYVHAGRATALIAGTVLAAAGIAGAYFSAGLIRSDQRAVLAIGMLCVPVFALLRMNGTIAQSHSAYALSFLPNQVMRPLLMLLAIVATWHLGARNGFTAETLLWLNLAIVVAIALCQHWLVDQRLAVKAPSGQKLFERGRWVRAGAPMMVVTMFTSYFPELTMLIAGYFLSAQDMGVFNVAFRVAFIITFGIIAVDAITTPRLSQHFARGDLDNAQQIAARGTLIKTAGGAIAILILIMFGEPILALFGDEFPAGYYAMLIVAAAQLLRCVTGPVVNIMNIAGQERRMLAVFALLLPVTIVAQAALATTYGPSGAAFAVFLVVATWVTTLYRIVTRSTGLHPSIVSAVRTGPVLNPR